MTGLGIKRVASVCGACEFCTNGQDELHCSKQTDSGFTAAGTFQQYCLADGKYATRIPEGVKDEEAGQIVCGGGSPCSLSIHCPDCYSLYLVTAYTACKRSAIKPGQ